MPQPSPDHRSTLLVWWHRRPVVTALVAAGVLALAIGAIAVVSSSGKKSVLTSAGAGTSDAQGVGGSGAPVATSPTFVEVTTTTLPLVLEVRGAGLTTGAASYDASKAIVSAGAVIGNPTNEIALDVQVNINLKDATGNIVKTETARISYISPGSEAYASDDFFLDDGAPRPVSVDAQVLAGSFQTGGIYDFAFSNVRYSSDQYNGQINGSITNPSGVNATQVHAQCALFNGASVIGGFYTFVDLVPAGGTSGFHGSNGLIPGMHPTSIKCYGTLSALSR